MAKKTKVINLKELLDSTPPLEFPLLYVGKKYRNNYLKQFEEQTDLGAIDEKTP